MLSRRWIRPIASAKSGATETTATFAESSTGCVSIESVTIRRPIGAAVEARRRSPRASRQHPFDLRTRGA
jgi:hypothetical protein